jgi:hypothetical protein
MVSVLTPWQENDVGTPSLTKNDVVTHSLTEKWFWYSLFDKKIMSILTPKHKKYVPVLNSRQKNGVGTHSLIEK